MVGEGPVAEVIGGSATQSTSATNRSNSVIFHTPVCCETKAAHSSVINASSRVAPHNVEGQIKRPWKKWSAATCSIEFTVNATTIKVCVKVALSSQQTIFFVIVKPHRTKSTILRLNV